MKYEVPIIVTIESETERHAIEEVRFILRNINLRIKVGG
jgi:hypothetical protein